MDFIIGRLRKSHKTALIHLVVTAIVVSMSIALVLYVWYPGKLAEAQDVRQIVLTILGVEIVIGPLITLIVFDPKKLGIRFDIAFVVAIQLMALSFGLFTIHGGRPIYVVFNVDRFDVVSLQDVDRNSLKKAPSELQPNIWKPRFVGALLPDDPTERSDLLFSSLGGGPDLPQLPEYYVPLSQVESLMKAKLHPMAELRYLNDLDEAAFGMLIEELGGIEDDLGYLPLVANTKEGIVVLSRRTGDLIGVRMLTPRYGPANRPANLTN